MATWKQGDCLIIFNRNDPPQPNVPELDGIDLVTGTMPQQLMAYDTQVNLAPNQYSAVGYRFIGWSTRAESPFAKSWLIGDNDYSRIAAEIANNGGQFFENQALFPATLGEIPVGHDVNLYAVWVLEEYTVTFLTSGDIVGGNIIGWLGKPILEGDPRLTQTVEYMGHPSTMHKPGDLTHLSNCIHLQANPGYVFAGWNYEVTLPDGTKLTGTFPEEGEIGSITVYGNTMVRAIWEKTYKLTYQPGEHGDWAEDTIFVEGLRGGRDMLVAYYPDLNGPIDNDPSIPALDYGSGIAVKRTLPLSKDADFMFDGWVSNDGRYFQTVEEVTKALMSRGDLELTANWVRRPVLVRFDVDGGIPVDDTTALDDRYCTPYEQITLPFIGTVTKPGYHLTGWDYDGHTYKVGTNYSDAFTVPRMGATLKAHWEEDLATLTFKSEATNTTGAGYIVSDFGYKTTHDPGCGSDGKVGAGWCYWHGLSGWYYDDAAGHQVVKVSGFHDEWFNRTTGEVDYVINNAVKPDGKMYQKWYDTLQFNVSAISGQTRGWLSKDSTLVVSDTPIQVRAVARTGYHFLNWVDSNGVVVCDTPEFVAPAGASGVWTNATYYAIFTEDQDIVIKYRVDDPDHGWVIKTGTGSRASASPSPRPPAPRWAPTCARCPATRSWAGTWTTTAST